MTGKALKEIEKIEAQAQALIEAAHKEANHQLYQQKQRFESELEKARLEAAEKEKVIIENDACVTSGKNILLSGFNSVNYIN